MRRFLVRNLVVMSWFLLVPGVNLFFSGDCYSQNEQNRNGQYLIGDQEKLEMIVHIWGEVAKPGEYRVPDNTNVLELISKAGGPTQFSNLKQVILTRERAPIRRISGSHSPSGWGGADRSVLAEPDEDDNEQSKRVVTINLNDYLQKNEYSNLPKLRPGDVIRMKRNSWFRWREAVRILSQVAIVVQAAYYFSRINN